jgi:hypothetical protein
VTSSPSGIDCGSTCSAAFRAGSQVTLTAKAAGGSTFGGWSGSACGYAVSCKVTMSAHRNVYPIFTKTPA